MLARSLTAQRRRQTELGCVGVWFDRQHRAEVLLGSIVDACLQQHRRRVEAGGGIRWVELRCTSEMGERQRVLAARQRDQPRGALHDRGVPNAALFGGSQGAVLGLTKSLGLEWGRTGVTVNAIGLGFFDDVPGVQNDEELRAVLERYIPLRRLGKPEDIQGAVVYLASEDAGFVDAEVFVIDGAIVAHG